MAIDLTNRLPSNPSDILQPSRAAPAKENAEAQVRQLPSPGRQCCAGRGAKRYDRRGDECFSSRG